MASPQRTGRLWWLGAPGLVILLALALAGGGVSLALRQGRAIERVRIQGLRDRAESISNRLQTDLNRMAEERIVAIRQAFANRDDLAIKRIAEGQEWIELVFVYDRHTLITWPAATVARWDRPHEAFAPPSFGLAEQIEFVDHNLDEAVELYKRCTGEGTPVYWQLRAHMAIAGCRGKQRRFNEAIEIYQRLRTRYALVLRGLDEPSLFSVNLALVDVLTAAGRPEEAARSAEALLREAATGQVPLPARECAGLLVDRFKLLTHARPEEVQQAERELARVAGRQEQLAGAVAVVRTWMEPRLDPPVGRQGSGVQFVADTLGARPRSLAYRRFDSGGYETVIGLCIYLPALYRTFIVPTVRAAGGDDLTVNAGARATAQTEAAWTQVLASPLQSWQVQPAPAFIERVGWEVRRQTGIYIALTLLAVGALVGATAAMLLAIRREMALTRLKDEFVANVSHELKTPLAMIRLFGETLLNGRAVGQDRKQEYYRVITRESERLAHLIDNILDFSRIDAGRKLYRRAECDIAQVVRQTVDGYRLQLDHHGFECSLDVEADLPVVQADPEAISQAVLNLLNNAVKYSREHKRVAICVARHRQGGQSGVTIAVSDRGIGIPPDDRARVFDSFFRGSHEVVRSTRGSGLGLTLVQHIVAGHNGEVWVDSTLGQGSTFTIYLPGSDDRDSRKSGPQARHPIRSAEIDYRVCGPDLPEGNRPSPGVQ